MVKGFDTRTLASYLQSYLRLKHYVVGVGVLEDHQSFVDAPYESLKGKAFYCQMVEKGTRGQIFKVEDQQFSCDTSARMVGTRPYYEEEEDIEGWFEAGFYKDHSLAVRQKESVRPIPRPTRGLAVGALKSMTTSPSVVIVSCNAYQAMRLTQAYTYGHGFKKDFAMSGMCGVCFESTASPHTKGEFSISLLCSSARFMAKWPDDTLMVSFPFEMTEGILEGLVMTADQTEMDSYKEEISHQLTYHNLDPLGPLEKGKAYYY